MTPHQLSDKLREYQRRVTQMVPEQLEHTIRTEVVPTRPASGVSYVVHRTEHGVHLQLSGSGARRAAGPVVARLRVRAAQVVHSVVR